MKDDRLLVQGIMQKNSSFLEDLISHYGRVVYVLCARILNGIGSEEDVEECVSDTFVAVWNRIGEFDEQRGQLRTWIMILAKYRCLDLRRSLSSVITSGNSKIDVDEIASLDEFSQLESRHMVREAIHSLKASDQEIIYRRYYLLERIESIASHLELTEGVVQTRLWRARRQLREKLSWERETGCEYE